ncbi:hypothetical protein PSCLAVI8L_280019 [Pseudoclavibacter sp. 8L]|nr:hypothetical protein PSCLAVI8L_280019 [Pseudoclavibacter sp. 8L]
MIGDDLPVFDSYNAFCNSRDFIRMCHYDDGHPGRVEHLQVPQNEPGVLGVQISGWLIGQQNDGLAGHGPCKCDPLSFTSGQGSCKLR